MRTVLAVPLVSLLMAACGSTVATGHDVSIGTTGLGSTGDGLGGTGQGTTGGTSGLGSGTTGQLGAGSGGTTGGSTGSLGTTGGGSGSTGVTSPLAVGPGVTATTIAVGLPYSVNSKTAAAALGASGAGVGGGDGKLQWQIVLADINAHGGVLGRKLVPVFHEEDSTDQTPLAEQQKQACSEWTEDHKVFAVIAPDADPGESLLACVHHAGAAQIYVDLTRSDAQTFARYPYYLEAGTLGMDRLAAAWPGALARQSYFTGWNPASGAPGPLPVKVGIVSFGDAATVRAVEHQLKPALAAAGHPVFDWVQVSYPNGAADNGRSISEVQAATLKFNSDHVTHVLPFDAQGAGIGAFFAEGANQQRYYPRYGLNTGVGAQTLHDTGLWPTAQLHGAVGFGWLPLIDIPFGSNPNNGAYSNDSRRYCVNLMAKHGEDMSSAIVQRQAIAKCDELRFLKQALEAGGAPTRQALVVGANRLGGGFRSGLTFSTRYDARHHDGVAAARDFAFDATCDCFRYTSPPRTVP